MKRLLIFSAATLVGLLIAIELVARFVLGLGTPPLSIAHPTIEYMFKPNQDVYRFHNEQLYNAYGMRSPDMPDHPERVVLAFGDSVLNGGNQTDHAELATSLLQSELEREGVSAFVGNVSAGSWGPGNMRAWIDEYGLFDADMLIFVLSSHDFSDQPTFAPLDPTTHPTKNPPLAISEAVQRYLPRYLSAASALKPKSELHPFRDEYERTSPHPTGREDLEAILRLAGNRPVCLIQHLTQTELQKGEADEGHEGIADVFASAGSPVIQLHKYIGTISPPTAAYRDDIHINSEGQTALFQAMEECLQASGVVDIGGKHAN